MCLMFHLYQIVGLVGAEEIPAAKIIVALSDVGVELLIVSFFL